MSDNPTIPPQDTKPKIKGEPLDIEDLLSLAPVDAEDIASAMLFFDENAPEKLKGTLE